MVFDRNWFKKNNNTLCWLANHWLLKYWFRWLLRIHNDIPFSTTINQITPNLITYNGKIIDDKLELITDFRTHEKFGKRLYYGLKPLWYILHFWDWSTQIQPVLNCGFDTLPFYPEAGSGGGNTTCDGSIRYFAVDVSFSDLVNGATGDFVSPTAVSGYFGALVSYLTEDSFRQLFRYIATIDTSALTASANISAASFYIFPYSDGKVNNLGSDDLHIVSSNPTNNNDVVVGDYSRLGSDSFGSISYADFSTVAYNEITLNDLGKAAISKTGITKLGTKLGWDVNGSFGGVWGSAKYTSFSGYQADQDGTNNDPKLVVTYTLGGGADNSIFFGMNF